MNSGKQQKYFATESDKLAAMARVAKEYGRTKNGQELADELHIPIGTVMTWVANMRSIGIEIPKTYKKGNYVDLIEHLQQTMPTILKQEAHDYLAAKKSLEISVPSSNHNNL